VDKVEKIIQDFVSSDVHANSCAAFLFIMAHGDSNDQFHCSDNKVFKTSDVVNIFETKASPALAKIPKLITLQHCR
jgi:hypothetical protein